MTQLLERVLTDIRAGRVENGRRHIRCMISVI